MFVRNLLRTIPKLFTPTPKLDIRAEDVDDEEPEGRKPPLKPPPLEPETVTRPGFFAIGRGPGAAQIVLATDAEKPDPCAPHWRGYFGPYVAWGTVQGCTSTLIARARTLQRFSGVRVVTGPDAVAWMAEHGDPCTGEGG